MNHYSTSKPLVTLTLLPEDDATVVQMLTRFLDDRITIVDTAAGHRTNVNGDFFIEAIEMSADKDRNLLSVTWVLSSFLADQFWVLGSSELGVDTVLGY